MDRKHIIKMILFLSLSIILIILVNYIYCSYLNKIKFEDWVLSNTNQESNSVFSIDNITFFSSCNASSSVNANSSITIKDLYQFTDIALFINNGSEGVNYNLQNTLKEVWIENISFVKKPSLGEPSLYYQTLSNFASGTFLNENKITNNSATFRISNENVIDYTSTDLHNNCANPITLCYINSNITYDYTVPNTESLTYNGTLLKTCNVPISNIETAISFDIYLINNLNEKFKCPVYLEILLSGENSSIYDGTYTFKPNTNFIFYKIS